MARIRTIKPDPIADAEFIGLFLGEGHVDLATPARGSSMVPRVRIAMRDDDAAVLRWCQDRFGGSLSPRASTRSVCWQLTGKDAVSEVVAVLLTSRIPSKKLAEVRLLDEALKLIPVRGQNISPEASRSLRSQRDELKALRVYSEVA